MTMQSAPMLPEPSNPLHVASQATTQPSDKLPLASLPLWQRRYLVALQATGNPETARRETNVSNDTVVRYLGINTVFAHAHDAILAGLATASVDDVRQYAQGLLPTVVRDAYQDSRDGAVKPADRVANRRFLGDMADALPRSQGTQVAVSVTVSPGARVPRMPPSDSDL